MNEELLLAFKSALLKKVLDNIFKHNPNLRVPVKFYLYYNLYFLVIVLILYPISYLIGL